LAEDDAVMLKSGEERLDQFAERLKQEPLTALENGGSSLFKPITISYQGEEEQYHRYCATHRIAQLGCQRLVINHRQADLSDRPAFSISNRLTWQASGIPRLRGHRWPVAGAYGLRSLTS